MPITACNYGAHDFVLQTARGHFPAPPGLHLHVCAACDATYFAKGAGPCYACRRAEPA